MNALLVCAAPVTAYEAIVGRHAEAADFVIAVDGGAALCLAADVLPDLVVGDLDSLDASVATDLRRRNVPFVSFPVDKDATDLDLALVEARRRGARTVTVCAAFSGRLDHTLVACGAISRCADLRPVLVGDGLHGWVGHPVHRPVTEIAGAGVTFSVIALESETVCSVSGARWPLERRELDVLSGLGISNRVAGDVARVHTHTGVLLVLVTDARLLT